MLNLPFILKALPFVADIFYIITIAQTTRFREPSGSVVECLTRDKRASGSSLTSVTALCP